MNNVLFIFMVLWTSTFDLHSQEDFFVEDNMELQRNEFYHLFGNNVVLRSSPSSEGEAIDTLTIDSKLQILENTQKNVDYLGREATWYKVKVGSKKGYILDEFIALERKVFNTDTYLFQLSTYGSDSSIIRIRLIDENKKIHVISTEMRTFYFSAHVSDNKGLADVKSILRIQFFAEACGINGGEKIFFHVNSALEFIADLSSIGDGGVFSYDEQLIYPNDEQGIEDAIIYRSELVQYLDDDMTWEEIKIVNRQLLWKNGVLAPDIPRVQKEILELEEY